jgi:anti-sigma regulatory factor (Ser/Thr protein kinase)
MSHTVTDKPVKLSISSTPGHLCVVRAAAEALCRALGFDEQAATHVVLSVDEALSNVIRHAYGGAEDQPIEVELGAMDASQGVGLRICIRDHGRSVDPAAIRSRDLDDVRPGGLGVHIMNECMDCVEYRPGEGGGTVLTMTKRLPPANGEDPE